MDLACAAGAPRAMLGVHCAARHLDLRGAIAHASKIDRERTGPIERAQRAQPVANAGEQDGEFRTLRQFLAALQFRGRHETHVDSMAGLSGERRYGRSAQRRQIRSAPDAGGEPAVDVPLFDAREYRAPASGPQPFCGQPFESVHETTQRKPRIKQMDVEMKILTGGQRAAIEVPDAENEWTGPVRKSAGPIRCGRPGLKDAGIGTVHTVSRGAATG